MQPEQTLKFIADRYKLDLSQPNPIKIPASRWHDLGHLLTDLNCELGVEVGVYRGRFTQALAKRAPKMQLVGIDAWKVYPGYKDYEDNDLESEAYLDAKRRTEGLGNVKLVNSWSVDASKMFKDESIDYIFIDANHSYEWVVEDMKAWIPKIKKGGIVMGHDYFVHKKLNFGVIQAVNGWVETHQIKHLFTWTDNCPSWMFVKE